MSLVEKENEIINQLLLVWPIYGYGWTLNYKRIETPTSFHVVVKKPIKTDKGLVGFNGQIVEDGHIYNGYYIYTSLRTVGIFGLEKNIGDYNIEINEMSVDVTKIDPLKDKYIVGFGYIGKNDSVVPFIDEIFHNVTKFTCTSKKDVCTTMKRVIIKYNDDNQKFCLFNGYAGFSYGTPSNPKFIDNSYVIKIFKKYIELTNKNPFHEMEKNLMTLLFDTIVNELVEETGYRMLGYFNPEKCLYGDAGLG